MIISYVTQCENDQKSYTRKRIKADVSKAAWKDQSQKTHKFLFLLSV